MKDLELNAALEPGDYRDFTGYVNLGGTEGYAENATFMLSDKIRKFHSGLAPEWMTTMFTIVWRKGEWLGGTFRDGAFYSGVFHNGLFIFSSWNKGLFKGGVFRSSEWKGGIWTGGTWDSSNRMASRRGVMHDVEKEEWPIIAKAEGYLADEEQ